MTGQRSNQLNYVPAPLLSTSYSALWIALNRLVSLVVSVAHSSQPRNNDIDFTWTTHPTQEMATGGWNGRLTVKPNQGTRRDCTGTHPAGCRHARAGKQAGVSKHS